MAKEEIIIKILTPFILIEENNRHIVIQLLSLWYFYIKSLRVYFEQNKKKKEKIKQSYEYTLTPFDRKTFFYFKIVFFFFPKLFYIFNGNIIFIILGLYV